MTALLNSIKFTEVSIKLYMYVIFMYAQCTVHSLCMWLYIPEGRGAHSHYYNVFEMQQYGAVLQLGMGGNDFLAYAVMVR